MPHASAMLLKPFISAPSTSLSRKSYGCESTVGINIWICKRAEVVCSGGMLKPRKFMQRRKKVEVFKDAEDEAYQKNWRKIMFEIEECDSAVAVLKSRRVKNQPLPKGLIVGTIVRFKQLKKWNHVSEILEWLRTQHWWDFREMDFLVLITAYGKQGNFTKAERILSYMSQKGYPPHVGSYTALMEAYGKAGQYKKAEEIFRRMQSSGPEPSAVTYQIILKIFVEGDKFTEAEEIFDALLNSENPPLKPDQKMFHMMIYMHKKAGAYNKARKLFSLMHERGIPQTTVTYNSLMSFESSYKEVANIFDQMERRGVAPDVVSYALLIGAYGKARREEEALAAFEEMLDCDIRPTRKAYTILLDAFAISGMVEQAEIVFKSMRRDRCTPDLCSYTTLLSAYVNAPDMEGAENSFKKIKQDGFEPNVVTYGTLIKGYAKENNLKKMMEKYEDMRVHGIEANPIIYTTIMDAFGRNKDFGNAVVWFNEILSSGVPPDQKAKNILLSLAKTAEEQTEAKKLVEGQAFDPVSDRSDEIDNMVKADDSDDEEDAEEDDESYEFEDKSDEIDNVVKADDSDDDEEDGDEDEVESNEFEGNEDELVTISSLYKHNQHVEAAYDL